MSAVVAGRFGGSS